MRHLPIIHNASQLFQTSQEVTQLLQHDGLLLRRCRRLIRRIPDADGGKAPIGIDDIRLGRQAVIAAGLDVGVRDDARVDAAEDPLEVGGGGALVGEAREVDVEEHVVGQVRGAGVEDAVRQGRRQLRVDGAARRDGAGVPPERAAVGAREGERRDPLVVRGLDGGAHRARERHREPQVRADVGARHHEVRGRLVAPHLRPEGREPVLDRRHGEGVDPVQARVRRVGAHGAAVRRATVVLAGILSGFWFLVA